MHKTAYSCAVYQILDISINILMYFLRHLLSICKYFLLIAFVFFLWKKSSSSGCSPSPEHVTLPACPWLRASQAQSYLSSSKCSDSEIHPLVASRGECPASWESLLWLLALGFKRGALLKKSISEHLKNYFMSLFSALFIYLFIFDRLVPFNL